MGGAGRRPYGRYPGGEAMGLVERPVVAAALTMIGGLLVALVGLFFAIAGLFALFLFPFLAPFFFVGLLIGALIVLDGLLMLAVPRLGAVWGVVAVILAVLSLPFALGGVVIGFLLVVFGGFAAILWKPVFPITTARVLPPAGGTP